MVHWCGVLESHNMQDQIISTPAVNIAHPIVSIAFFRRKRRPLASPIAQFHPVKPKTLSDSVKSRPAFWEWSGCDERVACNHNHIFQLYAQDFFVFHTVHTGQDSSLSSFFSFKYIHAAYFLPMEHSISFRQMIHAQVHRSTPHRS